jgi:hypothetical protein
MFTLIYCRPFFRSRTQVHAAARVVRCLKLDIRFLRLCLTTLSIIRVAGCKSAKVVHLSNWLSGNPMLAHMGRTCARYRFWGCWDTCPIRVISRGGKIPAAQMTLMADENNYGRCKCSVVQHVVGRIGGSLPDYLTFTSFDECNLRQTDACHSI